MRIFISADIEGIGGVTTWDHARTDAPEYRRACSWMTADVNAAIEGAVDAGADDIVVRDAHGRARNILWEELHPRARLISGWDPTIDMMLGVDSSFASVFLIGYHPGPIIPAGVLSHTFSSRILDLRIGEIPANEAVIAAIQAGILGIGIGLITGQEELRQEIAPALPETLFVPTKRGFGYQAALLEPMTELRRRIRETAREAVARAAAGSGPAPFHPAPPLIVDIELASIEAANSLELIEGIERVSAGGVRLHADDAPHLIRRFLLCLQILYSVKDSG